MTILLRLALFSCICCPLGLLASDSATYSKEILFLDSGVKDAEQLANGVRPGIEVRMLTSEQDGWEQMADVLRHRSGLDAVHVISHGKPGSLLISNRKMDADALLHAGTTLSEIGNALNHDGDLLLYGCSLAEGQEGAAFMQHLAEWTNADVAASVNETGSPVLGADWELEAATGPIESGRAFPPSVEQAYTAGTLAFSSGQFLTGTANTNNFSSQVIGPGGTIYGAWNYSGSGGTMKFATWNGSGWTEVPGSSITGATVAGQLSGLDNLNQLGTDSFKVDSNGDFHVALAISSSSGGVSSQRGLGYGFFDASTQTWTFRRLMIFSNPNGWNNLGNGGAVMLLDSSENPHIVYGWSDANAPRWEYVEHAFFNGTSWNVTGTTNAKDGDVIDSLSGGAEIFGIDGAVDSSGNLHITYAREDANKIDGDIWYVKRTGSTWGTPAEIVDVNDFLSPSMALDSSGKVHVAWATETATTTFQFNVASNVSGSFVSSTAGTVTVAGTNFMNEPFDISLAINSSGTRVISGSYTAFDSSFNVIKEALVVSSESSPGTWAIEDALLGTVAEGNFSYSSMVMKDDNTVSLLVGTRNDAYTSGNLKFAVGIPTALPSGPSNSAPSFNDGTTASLTVNENSSAASLNSRLDINDTDSGDTLTWSVTSGPSSGSLGGFPANGTSNGGNVTPTGLTYTPTANTIGNDTFTIQISDGTDTDSITVTVTKSDVNPVITANSGSIAEDAGINDPVLTMAATGDTNGLTWSITGGNTGSAFAINSSTGAIRVNSALDFETTPSYTLTIAVDDEDAGTTADDTESVTVSVTDVNEVPTVENPVADFAVNEDATASTFDLTSIFSDVEDADADLSYTVQSNSNASLVSASVDGGTDVLTLSYQANQNGTADITVRATDSGTLFAEDTFTVTVIAVNDPPVVSNAVADFAVSEDAADSTFDLTSIFSDIEDADADLTYTVQSNSNPSLVTVSANGGTDVLTLNYLADQNGTADITVRATDSGTLFAEDTFTVTVNAVNDPPTVDNAVADFAVNEDAADSTFDLTSIFSDAEDADADLTYTVQSNSNPSLVTVSVDGGTDVLTLSYLTNQNGTADITVRATDSGTLFAEDTFTVTVNAVNDPPTVDNAVADFAVAEDAVDSTFDLTSIFSDIEDADTDLIYTISSNSNSSLVSASTNGGTDVLTLDYQTNQNGTAEITVRATDSGTLFAEDTFTVTVTAVNDPPSVSGPVADFTVDEDAADSVFDLTTVFSDVEDVDADLTYTVESNSNPSLVTVTANGGTDELTLTYLLNQNGTAEITVRATDSGTLSTEDTFTVTVNAVNDIPTVSNAVADFAVIEDAADSTFDLTSIFSDIDDADADLTYTVESNSNPSLISTSIDGGTDILTLDYLADQNGSAVLTVRATDSGNLFVEDTFRVDVTTLVDLVITVEENLDPVLAGNGLPGNLIHQVKVTNEGPSDASTIEIDFTQTLPTGVTLDSAVASQGSETGGTWTLPALAEGQMTTLTLTMSVPETTPGGTDTVITSASLTSVDQPLTATGDDAAEVRTSVSSPSSTGVDLESGMVGNFSSSLIEQRVKVTNNNPDPVPAFRILVGGLPNDVVLHNRHGTTAGGQPFIVIRQELASGGMTEVLMQYHRNSGLTNFTPEYTIEFLTSAEADALMAPPALGPQLGRVRFVPLANGTILLEWDSTPGKTYYVQYSGDMINFTTILPGIVAGANRTQWIDSGPPQTDVHPSDVTGLRVYRIMEAN